MNPKQKKPRRLVSNQMFYCCASIIVTGCTSVSIRQSEELDQRPTRIFPATVMDAKIITWPIWCPVLSMTGHYKPDAQEGMILFAWPFAVLDLPLAIIVDTLCSPSDLLRQRQTENEEPVELEKNGTNKASEVTDRKLNEPYR